MKSRRSPPPLKLKNSTWGGDHQSIMGYHDLNLRWEQALALRYNLHTIKSPPLVVFAPIALSYIA